MKMFNGILRSLTLSILGIALTAGMVQAAAPHAPTNLSASKTVITVNGARKNVIVLSWRSGTGENVPKDYIGFKIFGGKVEQGAIQFSQLATVDSNTFTYTVSTLTTSGVYKFYVGAYNNDAQSNTDQITVEYNPADTGNASGGDPVRFTTELVRTGQVGVQYVYDANATAANGGDVKFALITGPAGMTIDSLTGIIHWTPTAAGTYQITIRAYLASDPTKYATQTGTITVTGAGSGDTLHFTTELNRSGTVNTAYVYTAHATAGGNAVVRYALTQGPAGMTIDSVTGVISWTPTAAGSYEVHIKAYLASDPTRYVIQGGVIVVGSGGNSGGGELPIRFTTSPGDHGQVGQQYVYEAHATSNRDGAIHYMLVAVPGTTIPQGMVIDSVTGRLTFTPTAAGTYTVYVLAYHTIIDSIRTRQLVTIHVWACDRHAIITGTVTDQNGIPVAGENYVVYASNAGGTVVATNVVREGRYRLELDAGTYTISVRTNNTVGNPSSASVTVACGDSVTQNLTLERNVIIVNGSVTRPNGSGIAEATVSFMGYDTSDASHTTQRVLITVRTNASGVYQAILPGGMYNFIARASAPNDSFVVQYYNVAADAAHATVLSGSNTTINGVNFPLAARQTYNNSISGTVLDSAGNPVHARVTAYRIGNGEPHAAATVVTDSQGNFTISNLQPGTYILRISPIETPSLASGYYRQGGFLVTGWGDATTLTVTETSTITGLNVRVPNAHRNGGVNHLGGTVGSSGGINIKHGATGQSTALPVADALVSLSDESGTIFADGFTDINGNFDLAGLAPGSYRLYADMVGYKTNMSYITITDAQPLTTVTVTLTSAVSSVSVTDFAANAMALKAEPNVTSSAARLSFQAGTGSAHLSVLDLTGREVMGMNLITSAGPNTCTVEVSSLPAGTYFLRLQSATGGGITRIVVVK